MLGKFVKTNLPRVVYNKINRLYSNNKIKEILCRENNSTTFKIDSFVVYEEKKFCVCVAL